jgi:glycosyltransferase involved in cell wall biosynthesis
VQSHPISYLLIIYTYPPVLGGSEIEAQRVSEALQARGCRVKIVCAGGPPMPPVKEWIDPCGVPVRIIGAAWPKRLRGYIFALGVAWTLFKERKNYEIAYFLMQGIHLVPGIPMAGMLGKRIVMKFSCSSEVRQMNDSLSGRIELRLLRYWASTILILNPGMVEEAKEVGLDLKLVDWMPNPIDTDDFRPCSPEERVEKRRELGLGPDTPVVVFVGRLHKQKELPWLVGAFAKVVQQKPDAVLALIGEGPLREEITQRVRDLGIQNNVIFTGRLDSKGVLKWLQAADVFTLISAIEGLPCCVLEAMAAGLPPVLSDIPAHTQLVENEVHGLITELGNQDSIAQGLLRLLNDPELRAKLSAAARNRMIEQYSTGEVVTRYETLFRKMLAS